LIAEVAENHEARPTFFLTANKTKNANGFQADQSAPAALSYSVKVSGMHNGIRVIRLIRG